MIRWITPFLGTGPFTKIKLEDDIKVLDVRDLVDQIGNNTEEIKKKIDQGVDVLKEGCRLVVACDYGISRSNAVAAGILSTYEKTPFDEAAYKVVHKTDEQEIKLGPLDAVRTALGEDYVVLQDEKRILLTGGSGFVGESFISQFTKTLSLFYPKREEIDLSKGSTLLDLYVKKNKITHIVHLANPRVYTSNNALGETLTMLKNVIDVCASNGLNLVFPSTSDVYLGASDEEITADETTLLNPKGPFGEAKWLCECLINRYRKKHDLSCSILRSPILYGSASEKPKFIFNFVNKAKSNSVIHTHLYKNGKPSIDILHVSDFNHAISKVVDYNCAEDFNLGSGQLLHTDYIAKLICKNLESNSKINYRKLDTNTVRITMDYKNAMNKINWKPNITFQDGIKTLIEAI